MFIFIKVNKSERKLIAEYAKTQQKSMSLLLKETILEKIEDEDDANTIIAATSSTDYPAKVYTLEEAKKILGIK